MLGLNQVGALVELAMALVDVERETGRAGRLAVAADGDFADSFDPVQRPVGPDAAVIEPERLVAGKSVLHGGQHHVAIALVDPLDPGIERAFELGRVGAEERCELLVPADLARRLIPPPLTDLAGVHRRGQPCGPIQRWCDHAHRLLAVLACRRQPPGDERADDVDHDARHVTRRSADVVDPPEWDREGDRQRAHHQRPSGVIADCGQQRTHDQQRDQDDGRRSPDVGAGHHGDRQRAEPWPHPRP